MRRKIIGSIILIGIMLLICKTKCNAASLEISANRSTVNAGDSVTITVRGNGLTGFVNLSTSGGSLSETSFWIENNSKSVTLRTGSVGSIRVSASGLFSDDDANENTYSRSCTINVAEKKKQQAVTTVSEQPEETVKPQLGVYYLGIYSINNNDEKTEISLDKIFDLNVFEYFCNVPAEVKKIQISADAKDYNSTLKIEGTDNELVEGLNVITVSVSDGDKTIKYIINVTKAEEPKVEYEIHEKDITDKTITMPIIYFVLMQIGIIAVEVGGYIGIRKLINIKKKIK